MATTWSYSLISKTNLPDPTLHNSSAIWPNCSVIVSAVGPATSLSDGSAFAGLSTYLTKAMGARIIGKNVTSNIDYYYDVIPSATYTTQSLLIKAKRASTGALLTAATDLSGENFWIEILGRDQ